MSLLHVDTEFAADMLTRRRPGLIRSALLAIAIGGALGILLAIWSTQ